MLARRRSFAVALLVLLIGPLMAVSAKTPELDPATAKLVAQLEKKLAKSLAKEVKAQDKVVLFELKLDDTAAELALAEADVVVADAALLLAEADLAAAEAALASAEALVDQRELELEAALDLPEESDSKPEVVEAAMLALDLAQGELALAKAARKAAKQAFKKAAKAAKKAHKRVTKTLKLQGKQTDRLAHWSQKEIEHGAAAHDFQQQIDDLLEDEDPPAPPGPGGEGPPGGGGPPGEFVQPLVAVDCGDLNGYMLPTEGFELLSEESAPGGVVLSVPPIDTVHVAQYFPMQGVLAFPSDVSSIDHDRAGERQLQTALQLADPTVLTIGGLPPGSAFRLHLELGASWPWMEFIDGAWTDLPTSSSKVMVEIKDPAPGGPWRVVAQDLRPGTGLLANSLQSDIGSVISVWVRALSDDNGVVRVRLSEEADGPLFLAAFRVYPDEPLPLRYRRNANGPLEGFEPAVATFVDAFNAGDFATAETLALALSDDYQRGTALMHLIGWLDGSRDGSLHLAAAADEALEAAEAVGHPAATWLRSQLASFVRAFDHLDARAYSWAKACPEDGGYGFLNPDCAGQQDDLDGVPLVNLNTHIALRELRPLVARTDGETVLSDLLRWNAGTLDEDTWEPSPLLFASLKQVGVMVTLINPLMVIDETNPAHVETQDLFQDIFLDFVDLGFAEADVPADLELHLFRAWAGTDVHPSEWMLEDLDLFSEAQLAQAWWADDVALPDPDAGAPLWAELQRVFGRMHDSFARYWLTERYAGGELGGGHGDDVELLRPLTPLLAARQSEQHRPLLARIDDLVDYGLLSSGWVDDGYYGGDMVDVEHAGEFATDPFRADRGVFGWTARSLQLGFRNGRHILDQAEPENAFAGVNLDGRTHFKSFWYTANGPDDNPAKALDVFLNGRATFPALSVAAMLRLPTNHVLLADLRAWARGWRDDALLAPGAAFGKPLGFPAPAQWPSGDVGTSGLWYTEESLAGDDSMWKTGDVAYVLELMRVAYRSSTEADRWTYLVPAVRMVRTVLDWEAAGSPAGPPGSADWAAEQYRNSLRLGPSLLSLYRDLSLDPDLASQPDPDQGGAPYVDPAFLSKVRHWLEFDAVDQGAALRYALGEPSDCVEDDPKSTDALPGAYVEAAAFYRSCFPLLTKHAMRTDRVPANHRAVLSHAAVGFTGTSLKEGPVYRPLLRWIGGATLDVAVHVNHADYVGERVSAFVYNYAGSAVDVTMVLEEGLVPGRYLVEVGAASGDCDIFPGAALQTGEWDKPGSAVEVDVTLPVGLSLVVASRVGSAPVPASHELAVDPPRLEAVPGPQGTDYVVTGRVVNAGTAPSGLVTLRLVAVAAVDEAGAVLNGPGFPDQEELASVSVSLGGAGNWTVDEEGVVALIASGSTLAALLEADLGLLLRVEVSPQGVEGDSLNNSAERIWSLE